MKKWIMFSLVTALAVLVSTDSLMANNKEKNKQSKKARFCYETCQPQIDVAASAVQQSGGMVALAVLDKGPNANPRYDYPKTFGDLRNSVVHVPAGGGEVCTEPLKAGSYLIVTADPSELTEDIPNNQQIPASAYELESNGGFAKARSTFELDGQDVFLFICGNSITPQFDGPVFPTLPVK